MVLNPPLDIDVLENVNFRLFTRPKAFSGASSALIQTGSINAMNVFGAPCPPSHPGAILWSLKGAFIAAVTEEVIKDLDNLSACLSAPRQTGQIIGKWTAFCVSRVLVTQSMAEKAQIDTLSPPERVFEWANSPHTSPGDVKLALEMAIEEAEDELEEEFNEDP